jgi:hypothetical protein
MKKLVFNNSWLLLLLMSLTVSSCLKDEDYKGVTNTEGGQWVSIPKAAKAANVVALESKDEAQPVDLFSVTYDYVNPASEDITVKLAIDNSIVTAYDADAVPLPASSYTIPLELVIPKGKRLSDVLTMTLKTNDLDATAINGLGIKIESVSPSSIKIPSNLSKVLFIFQIKNKYDGEYTVTGTMVDLASSTLTGYFPMDYYLITSGARSVDGFDPVVWEDYFIPIRSGAALSGYGSFSPVFQFDANDKIIAVTNIYGQPAGNTRYAELDPTGENSWDPDTRTIKVKFFMYQPSAISGPRVKFDWTMTYVGPRP